MEWLLAQPNTNFCLQLVGGRERASIEKFIRQHQLSDEYAIFERELKGQPWFSLIHGSFKTREQAIEAINRLPKGISKKNIWPRTFASVLEQMVKGH